MPILDLAGELCCPNEGVGSSADGVLELAELAAFCGELSLIGLFACRLEVNGGRGILGVTGTNRMASEKQQFMVPS